MLPVEHHVLVFKQGHFWIIHQRHKTDFKQFNIKIKVRIDVMVTCNMILCDRTLNKRILKHIYNVTHLKSFFFLKHSHSILILHILL